MGIGFIAWECASVVIWVVFGCYRMKSKVAPVTLLFAPFLLSKVLNFALLGRNNSLKLQMTHSSSSFPFLQQLQPLSLVPSQCSKKEA